MSKTEYSPYKIVHHPLIMQQLRDKEQVFPLQVHLVPTNRCNQNCQFCAYRMHGYSSSQNFEANNHLPENKLLEIIDDLGNHGCKAIQFTGGGEPLVHEAIAKALELTYLKGMDAAMVTNGQALKDDTIDLLARSSWVRISVDAFNPKTYSETRSVPSSVFGSVISNIEKLVLRKSSSTIIGVGFVVTKENYTEVYQAAKLFKEIGADNIRIAAAFTTEGFSYFDDFFDEARDEVLRTVEDLSDENFTVFNLFNDRVKDLFEGAQNYDFCPMKNLVPYIGADQNVYTCCTLAYNRLGLVGSIKDRKFSELWNDDNVIEFMKNHNPRKTCRLPCMFDIKNRFINYCISHDAKHINFI
jgi:MoaA/NifB/PqqE/SkfB family radical SAM enzyme